MSASELTFARFRPGRSNRVLIDDATDAWKPETHQNEFWKLMLAAAPKLMEPQP